MIVSRKDAGPQRNTFLYMPTKVTKYHKSAFYKERNLYWVIDLWNLISDKTNHIYKKLLSRFSTSPLAPSLLRRGNKRGWLERSGENWNLRRGNKRGWLEMVRRCVKQNLLAFLNIQGLSSDNKISELFWVKTVYWFITSAAPGIEQGDFWRDESLPVERRWSY